MQVIHFRHSIRPAGAFPWGDQALLPAFVDTHQHFASFATFHAGLNVMDAESNQEIADMIASFLKTCKNKTLIAFGASPVLYGKDT